MALLIIRLSSMYELPVETFLESVETVSKCVRILLRHAVAQHYSFQSVKEIRYRTLFIFRREHVV